MIGWLHISDLHFRCKTKWKDSEVLQGIIVDLKALKQLGRRVDLVFCTGDIGFGETSQQPLANQYEDAKSFFDLVLEIFNLPQDRLFLVPGNHDIDRNKIQESITEYFRNKNRTSTQINQQFQNPKVGSDINRAMERLDQYRNFIQHNYPHIKLDTNSTFGAHIEINGITLAICGLNSAWSCVDDKDKAQLWLAGEAQLYASKQAIELVAPGIKPDIRIGLLHHPQDWLNEAENQQLRGHLPNQLDFLLHGHAHDQWVETSNDPMHTIIAAGAATADSQAEFGYNLVQLGSGKAEIHLRQYDIKGRGWVGQNIAHRAPDGIWNIKPLDIFAQKEPSASVPPKTHSKINTLQTAPAHNRKHFGLESSLESCTAQLKRNKLLAVYGLAGAGKSVLINELHQSSEWNNLRLVTVTIREGSGLADLYGQIAPHLGVHEERPKYPINNSKTELIEKLKIILSNSTQIFLHIQRAHYLFRHGKWLDPEIGKFLEALPLAHQNCVIILETREKSAEQDLSNFEVTGLPESALIDYLASPPGLEYGWTLNRDRRRYLFQRLGGGHGNGAHAYGLFLLVRLAAAKGIDPDKVLIEFATDYNEELYDKLFQDLYQNVLDEHERALLFICSLYRNGIHFNHFAHLEHLVTEFAFSGLSRRSLLIENNDWFYLHDLASEQARKLVTDTQHIKQLHQLIAGLWLDQLRGQKMVVEANIRRAIEAIYHLEQGGQGERVVEITPNLLGTQPEATHTALWRIEARLYSSKQYEKVISILEFLLKIFPYDHKAMRFLGECRKKIFGEEDNIALCLLRQAVALDSGFPDYWNSYGHSAAATQDPEVISSFLDELQNAPDRVRENEHLISIMGKALETVGRGEEAFTLRREKIMNGSRSPAIFSDQAIWLINKKGDAQGALDLLDSLRKTGSGNEYTEAIYATALEASGEGEQAYILRQERIMAGTDNPAIYNDQARWLLDTKGDANAALKILDLASQAGMMDVWLKKLRARTLDSINQSASGG
ncbi:hypothetical protein RS1P1_43750 [Pseudomonas moraviensis]|nr:hypothetical protein RS1P1_43750 [Pseudomonas moraviensis]